MAVTPLQAPLFPRVEPEAPAHATVFTGNMGLPVHRWFRYSAGFSAAWVEGVIANRSIERPLRVLDPFAGSGTTLIAAQVVGAEAWGVESHPFVTRVAQAKLRWTAEPEAFLGRAEAILRAAGKGQLPDPLPPLLGKIFHPAALSQLYGLREALLATRQHDDVDDLLWLALVAILRACSPAGTAQWQYVLPNKTKARVAEPFEAFRKQAALMADDMRAMQQLPAPPPAALHVADSRADLGVLDGWADLVITSPPYPNNYDYADATRIEMTFLGEIAGWGDLQETVRRHLIRSCSQHMVRYDAKDDLASARLRPIADELREVYVQLGEIRKEKGGRKSYHSMVVAYFADLAHSWQLLRRGVADGGEVIFVVGDSAPYGIHVPVERWLGELALAAGFDSYTFDKLRDRNIKWKNRKHRVPLQEGLLVVKG
jgi:hypothetical protein